MIFAKLKNQSGGALIQALVVLAITTISSLMIIQQGQNAEKQSRLPRIKSQMSSVEQKIRQALTNPSSFSGCNSTQGYSSCQINKDALEQMFKKVIPGAADCGNDCGIQLRIGNPDLSTPGKYIVPITIEYQGREVSLKRIEQRIEVPTEVLQSAEYICPDSAPLFAGFESNGRIKCNALPQGCGDGEYIASITADTLTPVCNDIVGPATCSAGQFMREFKWRADSMPEFYCRGRVDPFTYYAFTANVTIQGSEGPGGSGGGCTGTGRWTLGTPGACTNGEISTPYVCTGGTCCAAQPAAARGPCARTGNWLVSGAGTCSGPDKIFPYLCSTGNEADCYPPKPNNRIVSNDPSCATAASYCWQPNFDQTSPTACSSDASPLGACSTVGTTCQATNTFGGQGVAIGCSGVAGDMACGGAGMSISFMLTCQQGPCSFTIPETGGGACSTQEVRAGSPMTTAFISICNKTGEMFFDSSCCTPTEAYQSCGGAPGLYVGACRSCTGTSSRCPQ